MWAVITLVFVCMICAYSVPIRRSVSPGSAVGPSLTSNTAPLVGYDCNSTEPEILTLSALEVGPCPEAKALLPVVNLEYGQIIQKHSIGMVQVRTCQLTKSISYFKCARNWYNYQVYPPTIGAIVPLKSRICESIHSTGEYKWSANFPSWGGLEVNNTYQRSVNEVGWTDRYGYCEGGIYVIAGVTHYDIVVQSSLTISIRESWAQVDQESGKINIEKSLQCPHTLGTCNDAMTGTHVWTPLSRKCPDDHYVELYKGAINITQGATKDIVLLSINRPPFLFSAELGANAYVCSLTLRLTEFPDVFYLPQVSMMYQSTFKTPSSQDIQFITYLNAKITFSYHNLIQSAQKMYYMAMQRSCEIERDVLKNRIEIIRLTSQSGALSTLLQGGMFARANGEVIHLLKCEPVPVQLRNDKYCYDALPIIHQNQPQFLLPSTHIISANASIVPCTPITPLTYKIGGKWWSYTGQFQPVNDPKIISPRGIDKMPFEKIRSFSRGGMYSIDQIDAVQKMFAFPSLRDAVTTNLAAGITGYFGRPITMDMTSVMSDADMDNIAERNLKKWWGWFSSIGSTISGFIGIYFIYRVIKGALTTLLDAKELYSTFGVSFQLLAAVWSRLALYFINRANVTRDAPVPESRRSPSQGHSDEERTPLGNELVEYNAPIFSSPTAPNLYPHNENTCESEM